VLIQMSTTVTVAIESQTQARPSSRILALRGGDWLWTSVPNVYVIEGDYTAERYIVKR
jgi:hypothetical protein